MNHAILALDIQTDGVSAVRVNIVKKQRRIEAFEYIARQDLKNTGQPAQDAGNDWTEFVSRAAELIVKKMNPDGCYCIASFPAERLSFRNIQLPFRNLNKIKQILPFELEPQLPRPVDDLVFDFMMFDSAPEASPPPVSEAGGSNVLAVCVGKKDLASLLEALSAGGLEPDRIVPGGVYPLALALSFLEEGERTLYVAVADTVCHMCLVSHGRACLIRSCPVPLPDRRNRMHAVKAGLRGTLLALEERPEMGEEPQDIVISGLLPADHDLEAELRQCFEQPVGKADLNQMLRTVTAPALSDDLRFLMRSRALALAELHLAGIKAVNLYKSAFDAARLFSEHKKSLMTTAILLGVLLLLGATHVYLTLNELSRRTQQLDHSIRQVFQTTFPEVKTIVDPLQQMRVKVEMLEKESALGGDTKEKMLAIDMLNEISRRIPAALDVGLTRLDISPNSLLISGETADFNSVDDIKNRLAAFESFRQAEISSATTDKSGNRVRFKIKIDL